MILVPLNYVYSRPDAESILLILHGGQENISN